MYVSSSLQKSLIKLPRWLLSLYAAVCSFCVYFCMYAFRKPFTAAGYEGLSFLHIDYKIWLVTAQVVGYMLSKFYGIKFISSMHGEKRANTIAILILFAWLALLFFAITPMPYNIIFLLLNGFPLGMIWGLVFSGIIHLFYFFIRCGKEYRQMVVARLEHQPVLDAVCNGSNLCFANDIIHFFAQSSATAISS
jgi:Family of unknown function (DUF5690)